MPIMDAGVFRCAQLADPRLAAIPVVVISAALIPEALAAEPATAAILSRPFRLNELAGTVGMLTAHAS